MPVPEAASPAGLSFLRRVLSARGSFLLFRLRHSLPLQSTSNPHRHPQHSRCRRCCPDTVRWLRTAGRCFRTLPHAETASRKRVRSVKTATCAISTAAAGTAFWSAAPAETAPCRRSLGSSASPSSMTCACRTGVRLLVAFSPPFVATLFRMPENSAISGLKTAMHQTPSAVLIAALPAAETALWIRFPRPVMMATA